MCILFIANNQHETYPLIIAANRDEFHARETKPGHLWPTSPQILAGKDCEAGGSWMGVTPTGRFAALTNVRDPQRVNPDAVSRGELVIDYLLSVESDEKYTSEIVSRKDQYNGYNLLYGALNNLQVYNNHTNEHKYLETGFYGLSNADLDAPWPKLNRGVEALKQYCGHATHIDDEMLFTLLLDNTQADDNLLPETGVPIDWERRLSSIFIKSEEYGTRTSTVLKVDRENNLHWNERHFSNDGNIISEDQFTLKISPANFA